MGGSVGDFFKNLGNSNVTDPDQANWGDMDKSEKAARITAPLLGGLKGGLQAQQQQQRPQVGGAAPIQIAQSPQVATNFDPNYLDAWRRGYSGS